jgi:hypothetical protein
MPERQIKVVCGLNNETSILLKERLQEAACEKGLKLQIVSRYRKEGVYQYVVEHPDYQHVILQEILQSSSPYTAEDAALLTDEQNTKVIIVLNKSHAGNRYMRVLYAAGILDALYEEDAYAEKIVELLFQGRTRKEARKYYGIETVVDVEKSMQIIDEERLKSFLGYIEGGGPFNETEGRYEFVAARMTAAENLHLIKNMGSGLSKTLSGSELFQYYNGYLLAKSTKKLSFLRRREKRPLEPDAVLLGKKNKAVIEYASEEKELDSHMEISPEEALVPNDRITSEQESTEPAFVNENAPDMLRTSYEEESLFDLFGDEDHTTILDFIDEEGEGKSQETHKMPKAPPMEDLQKAKGEPVEVRAFPQIPLPVVRTSPRLLEEAEQGKIEDVSFEAERFREKGHMPKINKTLVLAAGIVFIGMALFLFCFIGIYSEKEIPMVEEIPVSAKAEEKEPPVTEVLQEETVTEDAAISEGEVNSSEMTEKPNESEREEQDVQEENKENEPQRAVGITEKSDTAKVSMSGGKSNNQQEIISPERAEGSTAGEDSNTLAAVEEPVVDISREAMTVETEEADAPQEPELQNYNGKIFSGDELEGVTASLRQNGFQVYIITRENGEGYFSAGEIREKCETACSFLASVNGREVKLIEQ